MEDCIFCKIVSGNIPCLKIYENNNTLAFLDIRPHTKGHTVVIPKKHAVRIFDLSEQEQKELMVDVVRVMHRIEEVLNPDGFNVGWNHNTAGGQAVPHLHVHVMPRYINDGGGSMHSIIRNPGEMSVDEVSGLFEGK